MGHLMQPDHLLAMNRKKVEILAPAGGMRQVIAAVENGADAVYMGGSSFNARMNADNFTDEEMKEAIDYAHLRNVKVYVTMNTLYTDEEIPAAAECAGRYYEMGADALIIQDLGFGECIRKCYPDFPMHLSTQATVFNRGGVRKAAELGYSRVVPARELSLEEIRELTDTGTEIEIFVHGALCMCYSGQCQMSRIIGGRSGNRGMCAQPCRLQYQLDGKPGHHLSPKDLCQLSALPQLIEAGVSSFKIEGRMKSPEYVAVVTGMYRKYTDMYYETGRVEVSDADMQALMQIFSRNGFTHGYLHGTPGKSLLSGDVPKHSGIPVGTVVSQPDAYGVLDIRADGPLKAGDGVEIRGKHISGNIITYVKEKKNGMTAIGDIRGKVSPGDRVFRTSSIEQLKEARKTFAEGKAIRKVEITGEFQGAFGKPAVLILQEGDHAVRVLSETACEKAVRKPLTEESVEKQLAKLGDTPYVLSRMQFDLEEGISLPVAALNAMRREAAELLSREKTRGRERKAFRHSKPVCADCSAAGVYVYDACSLQSPQVQALLSGMDGLVFVRADAYLEGNLPEGLTYAPYIPIVSKGKMDRYVEEHLDALASSEKGILVNNLGWLDPFLERGTTVYAGPGLNVYNGYSDELLRSLGVKLCAPSLELLEPSQGTGLLMVTEYALDGTRLTDRKNKDYSVVRDQKFEKTYIFVNNPPSLEHLSEDTRRLNFVYI